LRIFARNMKKFIKNLTLLAIIGLTANLVQAQDLTIRRNIYKIAPIHFTVNELQLGFEHIQKNLRTSHNFYINVKQNNLNDGYATSSDQLGVTGAKIIYEPRFYVNGFKPGSGKKKRLGGIYGNFYGSFATYYIDRTFITYDIINGSTVTSTSKYTIFSANFGVGLGYQIALTDNFYIDVYAGGGTKINNFDPKNHIPDVVRNGGNYNYGNYINILSPEFKGIAPRIGINLGIAI